MPNKSWSPAKTSSTLRSSAAIVGVADGFNVGVNVGESDGGRVSTILVGERVGANVGVYVGSLLGENVRY